VASGGVRVGSGSREAGLRPPPLPAAAALGIFAGAGVLLFVVTHGMIPWLTRATGVDPVLWWFAAGGLGVFLPLLVAAALLLRAEGHDLGMATWRGRLRFRRMDRGDWAWGVGGLAAVAAWTGAVHFALDTLAGPFDANPAFMRLEPLGPDRYWILAAWLPFWLLNIMGEEVLWRGVLLPRQEAASGRWAWWVHGCGWLLFHLAFGWQLLILLLPIILILPWVVQRRGNSWIGVLIHGGLNGPAFVALALGAF
jgi:membrane protease YdiL (CAAX protease family)